MPEAQSKTKQQSRGFIGSLMYAGWGGIAGLGSSVVTPFWSAWQNARYGSAVSDGKNDYGSSSQPFGGIGTTGPVNGGFDAPPAGTYETYRLMALHPTLVLAMAATFCPILSSDWAVEKSEDAPTGASDLIEKTFLPQRVRILKSMLRGLLFGFASMEQVWGVDNDGAIVPVKFKSLLQDLCAIYVDGHGELVKIQNQEIDLEPRDLLIYSHDKEGDNYYGFSRMERCRRWWANHLAVDDTGFKLDNKAAGTVPHVGYPQGTMIDSTGKEVSNFVAAQSLVSSIARGQGVVFPNHSGMMVDDLRMAPELAKQSLWSWGFVDSGNCGPAQSAILEKLAYYDALMVRAWCKPERMLLQATTSGSRADSETHQGLGDSDCEQVHDDILAEVNEQSVDRVLIENYGPKAKGTVKLKATPIVDENRVVDLKILDAVLKDQRVSAELFERIDMKGWAQRTGVKLKEGADEFDLDLPADIEPKGMPGENPTQSPAQEKEDAKNLSREIIRLSTGPHSFASTQINLLGTLKESLLMFGNSIPDDELAEDGRETEPHVTVKYGIHDNTPDAIAELVAGTGEVKFELGSVAVFPADANRDSDVVIVRVKSRDLVSLNAMIRDGVACTDTHPKYAPHVTIAYVKPGVGQKYLGRSDFKGQKATADSIVFSAADGSRTDISLL